jgi:histone deacetylase 1/2
MDAQVEDPNEDEDLISPDVRRPQRLLDSRRQADGELSDSDDEGEDDRRNHASHRDNDIIASSGARRFGAAVGIMSTGSTHGIGPTVALPVNPNPAVSSTGSEMDLDDDGASSAPAAPPKPKSKETAVEAEEAMMVDGPSS